MISIRSSRLWRGQRCSRTSGRICRSIDGVGTGAMRRSTPASTGLSTNLWINCHLDVTSFSPFVGAGSGLSPSPADPGDDGDPRSGNERERPASSSRGDSEPLGRYRPRAAQDDSGAAHGLHRGAELARRQPCRHRRLGDHVPQRPGGAAAAGRPAPLWPRQGRVAERPGPGGAGRRLWRLRAGWCGPAPADPGAGRTRPVSASS